MARKIALLVLALGISAGPSLAAGGQYTLIGWNDLGMHCMDGDYTVYAILPPYNTIHAQLIDPAGKLVTAPGSITATYQAVPDAGGSINTSSAQKSNFWRFAGALFGAVLEPDSGLTGNRMPGAGNRAQAMKFESALNWFTADGIPETPFDDGGNKNPYPMMRLIARDASGSELAHTDIVLPVSDEMDCRQCHRSGSVSAARPPSGWVYDGSVERDYKLNILRMHDDRRASFPAFQAAAAATGYSGSGLYGTVKAGKPILCAACHASNALGTAGQPGVPALTASMHGFHAHVTDPVTGVELDTSGNRSSCYRCHPGALTRCLRGVMGNAVGPDGSLEIQCQNCHGGMSAVGATTRRGWLEEPNCQSCHTGTATSNSGQIRFLTAFDGGGLARQPSNSAFATTPGAPLPGTSLYRFSSGHGGLNCEACHGSTHAEFPSSHGNDNVQSIQLQGSPGKLGECATCHKAVSSTTGGPHGLHTTGQAWVSAHPDVAERNASACQACHGTDYRGTVLSRALVSRTLTSRYGTLNLWPGFQVGCYACHNGPTSESAARNGAPAVNDASATTATATAVSIPIAAADPDGNALTLSVISQPHNGTATVVGTAANYLPFAGFEGTDTFKVAAWDGMISSNLATVSVQVQAASRPQFQASDLVSAATRKNGPVAPGELVVIGGSGMGPAATAPMEINSAGLASRLLGDTRVIFDGLPAPIIYTFAGAVSVVAPFGIAGKSSTRVQVEYQGISSQPVEIPVAPAAPGIFALDSSGTGSGVILNQDYSVNSAAVPAARGSVIMIYVTGLGQVDVPIMDGAVPQSAGLAPVTQPVTVRIGGVDAPVKYAGAAPGFIAGVMQVSAQVPDAASPGDTVPVVLSAGALAARR